MAFDDLSPRELLLELGLGGLEKSDAERCLQGFMELLQIRIGRRLNHVLGASVTQQIENSADTRAARARSFMLLQESLPEFPQYLNDEFQQIKEEFLSRLSKRVAEDTGETEPSVR